jgi:BlaI family transcriptional regulator, penicillinase repressor
MARPATSQPTDGELEILKVLWASGPTELGQVCAALRQHRQVATTTVATMLKVMMSKGLVKRSSGARGSLWAARISQKTATAGLLGKLLERVFDGSAQRLVVHLLNEGRLSEQDRREIRRMLESPDKRNQPNKKA